MSNSPLGTYEIQWTLVTVNAWIVNNLSLVNIFVWWHWLFYNINHMLNSKHLSLVNKIGDKTEYTVFASDTLVCFMYIFSSLSLWIMQEYECCFSFYKALEECKSTFDGGYLLFLDDCSSENIYNYHGDLKTCMGWIPEWNLE